MKMHIYITVGTIDKVEVAAGEKVSSHEKLVLNMSVKASRQFLMSISLSA